MSKNAAVLLGTAAIIALVSGCASKPQITAQQESSRYLSRAGRDYAPPGPAGDPWGPYIREASAKYDVPERWIREVMRQESGGHLFGRGGELITSGAGAMGLMQVMPGTYDDLRGRYRELSEDPYDPHNNILAGTAYLREMYDIYGSPGFLAAYNAGPGRLDDYLTRNRTLPTETRRYVASIGPRLAGHEPARPSPGAMYAMNAVPLEIGSGPRYPQFGTQLASAAPAQPIVLNRPIAAPAITEIAEAPRSAPVAVASAERQRPFIVLNRPDPVSGPAPVAVASAERQPPFITLNRPEPVSAPSRVVLAQAEPPQRFIQLVPPDRREMVEPAPFGARAPAQFARGDDLPLPEPPPQPERTSRFAQRAGQAGPRPVEVAMFPEPPRPPTQRHSAASELVALGPQPRGFNLISAASAAPIRRATAAPATGAWAVQVGAFSNESQAKSATAAARDHARDVLGGAHSLVAGVRQPGGTLYRARLGGLSQGAASQACERLNRARTNCLVVSPDAQR